MTKTHLVIPDPHSHPDFNNDRFDWLSRLIRDISPDVVINLGDHFDMPSLSGYDKGTKGFEGRRLRKDLDHGIEANDRIWSPIKRLKKKMPRRVVLEGNHEQRLRRVINSSPEFEGTLSFSMYEFNNYYGDVVEYNGQTPGVIGIDGVYYAHYFISGVMGRPVGGRHPCHAVLQEHYRSCVFGHIHTTDFAVRTDVSGSKIMSVCAGVFQDYDSGWAGECNKLWWRGIVVLRNVDNGSFDPQWISIDALRKEYGKP